MSLVVILCLDVILEVLRYGKRRQLAMLELVGRKFHWIIDRTFVAAPFLRLDLQP